MLTNRFLASIAGRALVAIALMLAALGGASAQYTSFQTVPPPNRTLQMGDGNGKFYLLNGGAWIYLPPPDKLDVGPVGFRKDDNTAPYSVVARTDGERISGWKFLSLPMQGNNVHLYNTGQEYLILSPGWPPEGYQGQHRTYVRSIHGGFYGVHHGDRGAIIRAAMDTGNGNVNLPHPSDMGWGGPPGYRNGYVIRVMLVAPTAPGNFVVVNATGTSIRGFPNGVVLDTPNQVVDLNFDVAEWFVVGTYKPSGLPDRP